MHYSQSYKAEERVLMNRKPYMQADIKQKIIAALSAAGEYVDHGIALDFNDVVLNIADSTANGHASAFLDVLECTVKLPDSAAKRNNTLIRNLLGDAIERLAEKHSSELATKLIAEGVAELGAEHGEIKKSQEQFGIGEWM